MSGPTAMPRSQSGVVISPAYIPERQDIIDLYLPGSYRRLSAKNRALADLITQLYKDYENDSLILNCLRLAGTKMAICEGGVEIIPLFLIAQAQAKGTILLKELDWFIDFTRGVFPKIETSDLPSNANLSIGDEVSQLNLHPLPEDLTIEEQDLMRFCEELWEKHEEKGYDSELLKSLFTNIVRITKAANGIRISAPGYYAAAKLGLIQDSDFEKLKNLIKAHELQTRTLQEIDEISDLGAKVHMRPNGTFSIEPTEKIKTKISKLKKGKKLEDSFSYRITTEEGPMRINVTLNYGSPKD